MRKIDNNTVKYYLPAEFRASMPISMHILHLSMAIVFTLVLIFLPDYSTPTYKDIFLIISSSLFVVFCIINWLYWGILRKGKIEIDNYAIHINTLFVKKSFRWQDISFIGLTKTYPKSLQIILYQHDSNESKMDKLNFKLLGSSKPIYNISLVCFSDVPWDSFMRTVNGIFDSFAVPDCTAEEDEVYPEDEI